MRDNPSIADQAVFTIGEIERMEAWINLDEPMRHTVRKLKRTAEQAVTDGLRLAQEIVYATEQMIADDRLNKREDTVSQIEQ